MIQDESGDSIPAVGDVTLIVAVNFQTLEKRLVPGMIEMR
jgi:hypothetical protein